MLSSTVLFIFIHYVSHWKYALNIFSYVRFALLNPERCRVLARVYPVNRYILLCTVLSIIKAKQFFYSFVFHLKKLKKKSILINKFSISDNCILMVLLYYFTRITLNSHWSNANVKRWQEISLSAGRRICPSSGIWTKTQKL